MKRFILILLVLMLCSIPLASAANITITAEPLGGTLNILPSHQSSYSVDVSKLQRNAIQRITVDVPTGTTISYTLWYGNGTTTSGQMIYNSAPGQCGISPLCQYSSVSIGGMTSSHYYVGVQEIGRIDIVGYGRNEDTAQRLFIIYDSTAGIHVPGDAMAYTAIPAGVIYKFTITANQPMTSANYYSNTQANVQTASTTSLLDIANDWLNLLIQIKDTVFAIFWFGYAVVIFIWDNIWLIIPLYFVLTGAMAVNKSKDIFKAMTTWFSFQVKLINFFINLTETVVRLITNILK